MIKKLIFGMFLWLPALYSVIFLIVSVVTGTIWKNWGFYFVGLSVTLIASVALTYLTAHGRSGGGDEKQADSRVPASVQKPTQDGEADAEAAAKASDETNRFAAEMKASPSAVTGERYDDRSERSAYMAGGRYVDPSSAPDPATAPDSLGASCDSVMGASGMDSYYYGGAREERRGAPSGDDSSFSPYVQPSNYGEGGMKLSDYDDSRLGGRSSSDEPPADPALRIYRLRSQPNVLLYSYPTEYRKYFVNEDGTLTLLSRQKKE